jgi:HSP20 family protein
MLVHWTPFTDAPRLQTQLNRSFDRLFDAVRGPVEEVFRPAVDIVEDAEKILITADLPGLSQAEVELQVDKDLLVVRGERKIARTETEHYRRYERGGGTFERSFRLPPVVDVEKISAAMKNGVLTLTLPKKAEAQPRQIKINS